jgi:DNA invertase Pin-like site-specific DNA recombinase
MTITQRKGLARYLNPPTKRELAALKAVEPAGRCFAYCRVSTVAQADEGQSLAVQARVIAGYAMQHGLEVTKTFTEKGVSGSRPLGERPQGAALLAALKPGDTMIITALDRAFRSALDSLQVLEQMQKRRIALHVVGLGGDVSSNGSNITSRLVFGILSHVAQFERERVAERVAEIKRDQRQRGRFLGGSVPWAHIRTPDSRIEPDPAKAGLLRLARRLRGQGLSLRKIQSELAKRGERVSHVAVDKATKKPAHP